jgi:hypothetical protein
MRCADKKRWKEKVSRYSPMYLSRLAVEEEVRGREQRADGESL